MKKLFIIIISLFITNTILSVKHIFFELDDVVFNINENTGIPNIFENRIKSYKKLFFDIINQIDPEDVSIDEEDVVLYYDGFKLPQYLNLYLRGFLKEQKLQALISQAEQAIDTQISANRDLYFVEKGILRAQFKSTLKSLFSPKKTVSLMKLNKGIIPLIFACIQNENNMLHAFSNKTIESLACLKLQYPQVFIYFKGKDLISEITQQIKPSSNALENILDDLNVNVQDCYLIDSDPRSIEVAQESGMNTFLYQNNTRELIEYFKIHELIN